ncbi:MAG: hypothetical protein U1F76_11715 [Candidatus Competibacteraceae bacterium]
MNQRPITEAEDKDIVGSFEALRRAARRAREIAAQTGTAIIVQTEGRIERITPYLGQNTDLDDSKAQPDLTAENP